MPSTFRDVGRVVGRSVTDIDHEKRQGGLYPSVDRERGPMADNFAYVTTFNLNEHNRKLSFNLEFFPIPQRLGIVQGAFSKSVTGIHPAEPVLPMPTTPGNLLVALVFGAGNTTVFPVDISYLTEPGFPPDSSYPIFPFLTQEDWTTVALSTTDYSGQNIGGDCGIPYQPHGFHCTAGLLVSVAWRKVGPTEITKVPMAAAMRAIGSTNGETACWLYEFGTKKTPVPLAGINDDGEAPSSPFQATLNAVGNSLSIFAWATSAGHSPVPTPLSSSIIQGTLVHHSNSFNDDTVGLSQQDNWIQIVKSKGVSEAELIVDPAYHKLNWCASSIGLPKGLDIPEIPYPENQILFSGGVGVSDTDLYASGVRVFIDGQDISQYVFGAPSGVVDMENNRWDDIDLTLWVKSPGKHSLVVTCDEGSADVDTRFEVF